MNEAGAIKLLLMSLVGFLLLVIAINGKPGSMLGALIDPASMTDNIGGNTSTPTVSTTVGSGGEKHVGAGILNDKQLVSVASGAGFRGQNLIIAVAVVLAESGGDSNAVNTANANGSTDRGLWQINSIHTQFVVAKLFDPAYNASAAYTISGGYNWKPWSTYNNGRYLAFMARASTAVHV
jgi:Lysozyme like domain